MRISSKSQHFHKDKPRSKIEVYSVNGDFIYFEGRTYHCISQLKSIHLLTLNVSKVQALLVYARVTVLLIQIEMKTVL